MGPPFGGGTALLVAYLIIEPIGLLLVGSIDEVTIALAATNDSLFFHF